MGGEGTGEAAPPGAVGAASGGAEPWRRGELRYEVRASKANACVADSPCASSVSASEISTW